MKILEEYPPNYEKIKARFDLTEAKPLFTYGDTIYNPHKAELRPDLLIHEEIHFHQQGDKPEDWWDKYLEDDEFRLSQEVDAYAVQYDFVKNKVNTKKANWFLDRLAETLSSKIYGELLTFQKAKTVIRKKQKELALNKINVV